MYLHFILVLLTCTARGLGALRRTDERCASRDTTTSEQGPAWIIAGNCCGFVLIPEDEQKDFYRGYGIFIALGCCVFLASCALLVAVG